MQGQRKVSSINSLTIDTHAVVVNGAIDRHEVDMTRIIKGMSRVNGGVSIIITIQIFLTIITCRIVTAAD